MKIWSLCAAVSASCWESGFWSRVETRPLADSHAAKRIGYHRQRDIGAYTACVTPAPSRAEFVIFMCRRRSFTLRLNNGADSATHTP